MKENGELFDTTQFKQPESPHDERRLYYVTNATNMRGILSSGLIRPKGGWPKYARDFQESFTGLIPLFCGGVPFSLLATVTEHDKHDFPVILEFLATGWSGTGLRAVNEDGEVAETVFESLPASSRALLVEGVVPLADLQRLHFAKPEDAKRFLSDCRAMANTRPDLVPIGNGFDVIPDIAVGFPGLDALSPSTPDRLGLQTMRRLDAVGGVLSALLRLQGKGGQGLLQRVFPEWTPEWQDDEGSAGGLDKGLIDAVAAWVENTGHPGAAPNAVILRMAMDSLSAQPFACGLSPEGFLDSLDASAKENLAEHHDVLRARLATIRASALHDQEPARHFQETGSSVMRGILLLLLDDAYREERRLPGGCSASASDLLIAEILRGALHGWTRVPASMRGVPRAELAIGYAMARLFDGTSGSLRFQKRSFEWVDEEALIGRLLSEILKGITDPDARKRLQRFAVTQGATGIEVKINVRSAKKDTKPGIARSLKGKKNKKVCFQLDLPWE
jgi:hypothetical protein